MNSYQQVLLMLLWMSITTLLFAVAMLYRWRMKSAERRIEWQRRLQVGVLEKLSKEHYKEIKKLQRIVSNRDEDVMALSTLVTKMEKELAEKQYRLDRAVMNGGASAHLADYRMQKVLALEDRLVITKGALYALCVGILQAAPGNTAEYEEFRAEVNAQLKNCRPIPK